MTQQTINPIRVSVSVGLDQKRCFEVFTDEMTSWWPAGHHTGEAPIEKVVIEPFVAGAGTPGTPTAPRRRPAW